MGGGFEGWGADGHGGLGWVVGLMDMGWVGDVCGRCCGAQRVLHARCHVF